MLVAAVSKGTVRQFIGTSFATRLSLDSKTRIALRVVRKVCKTRGIIYSLRLLFYYAGIHRLNKVFHDSNRGITLVLLTLNIVKK